MLSKKIKEFRLKNNLTQKDLADKLFVTPQAVSRWENGDAEPSSTTIDAMTKIFNISVDELFGRDAPKPEVIVKTETVYKDPPVVLGVCEICNKPIYSSNDLVRKTHSRGRLGLVTSVICKSCHEKQKKAEHDKAVSHGLLQRKRSFIWSGIITAVALIIAISVSIKNNFSTGQTIGLSITSLLLFPFISCLFLQNNFVEDMFIDVATFGFVRFPGLIMSLDLDGIIWFITVKLIFLILGFTIAAFFFIFAVALGMIVSIFVYPVALKKNFSNPELSSNTI